MKVLKSPVQSGVKITIVCSLHGEEEFSARVFEYFNERLSEFSGLKLILANEPALAKQERFLEQDLNRSFPGKESGNAEEKLAHAILQKIGEEDYLLDIHTSISDLEMTPILTSYNEKTKTIVNALDSDKVVFVKSPLADKSLIGQLDNGVSLEINKDLAKQTETMRKVVELVKKLQTGEGTPKREREIYTVTGTIPKTVIMPDYAANFVYVKELDLYPFLYAKDSYPDIHALKATEMKREIL